MFKQKMLIFNNSKSFKFLLNRLQKAARRIYLTCFIVTDDKYSRQILAALNKANARGVEVVVYGREEALVGDVEFGKKMLKNVVFVNSLPKVRTRGKVWWVMPKRGCHAKVFVIDNLIISTDRNISGAYYTTKGDFYEASDFVFRSPIIADRICQYFLDQQTFFVRTRSGVTFGLGNITKFVYTLLSSEDGQKIVTATMFPSMALQKILINHDHEIVTGKTIDTSKPLEDAYEKLLYFTALPKRTYICNKFIHHKIIVAPSFCAHGSFNLDMCSEHMVDEQIIVIPRKDIFAKSCNQLADEYTKLRNMGTMIKRTSMTPIGWILQQIGGEVLKRL